jgi:prophage regulatory protein
MAERVLRMNDLTQKTRKSRSVIYDEIRRGIFPRGRQLGPRAVGWLESDIDRYLAALPFADSQGREPKVA